MFLVHKDNKNHANEIIIEKNGNILEKISLNHTLQAGDSPGFVIWYCVIVLPIGSF